MSRHPTNLHLAPTLPQLRTPPPLTAEGKPFEVPHEKTFLQKYWIYIVVALVALALSPGAPEEEEGQGGAKK
ncbi:hypothetical protein PHLCEN_2v843 [Hermanssonia centrifuga]|uniref:Uncharacterized protein n=1 Tax=Hermanssonia centrifuga TaxID=98765 RepID=A0A2R6S518_9APHY|nr:hypothetical protein PHLCEN_2v843 [Hermanssonia centrifuga]